MNAHDCQLAFNADCRACIDHDTTCGQRCGTCDERMCMWFGPEPVAVACATHDDECQSCNDDHRCPECAIERMRARADDAWDAAATPGPYIDPHRDQWTDVAAEERADRRAHELAHLEDREESRS